MKDLFKNRQFLALLTAVLFMAALVFFPDLPFSEEQSLAFMSLIAAYIVGEGLEGKRVLENAKQLLKSRKFLAAASGLFVIVVQAYFPEFPVSADHLVELCIALGAVIFGSGFEAAKEY